MLFAYMKVYTKFYNPKLSSCLENSDKNVYMRYIGVTEGKIENLKKESKMRTKQLNFHLHNTLGYLKVYTKFENTGSKRIWEICDGTFNVAKEK